MAMPRLLLIALLACAGTQPLHSRTLQELPPGAAVLAGSPAAVDADALAALRGSEGKSLPGLLGRLGPEAFERAAEALLTDLAERRPTPAEWGLLASLKQHEPMVWQRHPETAAVWYVPVLDIAGMATLIEDRWRREDKIETVLAHGVPAWERWSGLEASLLANLLERLPPAVLERLAAEGVPPGLGSAPWQVLLARVSQKDLWRQALRFAPDDALRRLAPAVWKLEPGEARAWLERLRQERPELRSVAVLALGQDPDADARRLRLVAMLADPSDRAAAAAALAQDSALPDAALVDAFQRAPPDAFAGHLLVLRLRDSAATRSHLQRNERSIAERLRQAEARR